jgi:chemotaxis protein methyltransferase CheR
VPLSPADFDWVRSFVQLRSGVVIDAGQGYLVEGRLTSLAESLGMPSLDHLLYRLRHQSDFPLRQRVVEAMVTNETYFFRDPSFFDLLRVRLLPTLIATRGSTRHLSIWSAACSSGQELFSTLILLHEQFPDLLGWHLDLLGTDISTRIIERARKGEYTAHEVSRGLSIAQLNRFFEKGTDGQFRLDPALRDRVEFQEQNLIAPWPVRERFDLIFLRNVLIYFDPPTRELLLTKVHRTLRPDGYLILGGSETLLHLKAPFDRVEFPESVCYSPRS